MYARTENLKEDAKFFKFLANVEDNMKNISKANSEPKHVEAKEFWSKVDLKYVRMLSEPFAYKYDLEMFGYSIDNYFENLGLDSASF